MLSLSHTPMLASGNPSMEMFLLMSLVLPAWVMASIDSPGLVPYLILAWAFGPELRRVNDWAAGGYQSLTVVSFIPYAATGALVIPIIRYQHRIQKRTRRGIAFVLAALAYGTALGLVFNGLPGLIEGLGLLLPFLLVIYAASRSFVETERRSWLRMIFASAVVVSGYGWYQYFTAPPWDMEWMMGSGMFTSMGKPEAMGFRVFSSLNAAAPLGMFLAAAVVIGSSNRRWRGAWGILGVILVSSCLLLSLVRTAWIVVAVAVIVYGSISKGKNRWVTMVTAVVVGLVINFALPLLPGGDAVAHRMQSFGDLQNDDSTQIRLGMLGQFESTLTNPIGHGFGSTGVGAKASSNNASVAQGEDNGYLDLCTTLGLPMALAFFIGIILLGIETNRLATGADADGGLSTSYSALAVAMLVGYGVSLLSYNNFGAVGGVLIWLVVSCPLRPQLGIVTRSPRLRAERDNSREESIESEAGRMVLHRVFRTAPGDSVSNG